MTTPPRIKSIEFASLTTETVVADLSANTGEAVTVGNVSFVYCDADQGETAHYLEGSEYPLLAEIWDNTVDAIYANV